MLAARKFYYSDVVCKCASFGFIFFYLILSCTHAIAETFAKPRNVRVAVAEIKTTVIPDFIEMQARVVASSIESVNAVTNAQIKILSLKLGDVVIKGQKIAKQNGDHLTLDKIVLEATLSETEVRNSELLVEIKNETALLDLAKQKSILLAHKADRAKDLVANDALSVDAAETALNVSLSARQKVLVQQGDIARQKAQLALTKIAMRRLRAQIKQLDADIQATTLRAQSNGQIIFLADYSRSYAREGEVIARILDPSIFEVELEVPIGQLSYLNEADTITAYTLNEQSLSLIARAILPVQNTRTATRTVRFSLVKTPKGVPLADNAIVKVQLPVTSPWPAIIVPKDAVIPIAGGHIVYVAINGFAKRQSIKLGAAVNAGFIVRSGLEAGAIVVIRGNEQLSGGEALEIDGTKNVSTMQVED